MTSIAQNIVDNVEFEDTAEMEEEAVKLAISCETILIFRFEDESELEINGNQYGVR